jgi:2-polyprenyl-3-methyl-5-hydroxy-6-metoxy-1,4-benzoquinol methylase
MIDHAFLLKSNSSYDMALIKRNFNQNKDITIALKKGARYILNLMGLEVSKRKNINFHQQVNPSDYSSTLGIGSVVPCQIEAYFLTLNKYVDTGDTVLDIGFGLGYGLNILAIKAKEVNGVDVDQKAYDYCQNTVVSRNPKLIHLSLYNGYELNFPDNTFDLLTCVDVIEHVEDYDKLITEMLRVSRKGVFLSTPNRRPEYTNPDGTPKNYWHLREWSFEEFDKIIRKHGKVDWNLLNGSYDGPYTCSSTVESNTLTLSPFIFKG